MTETLPPPLKAFWESVLEQEHLGDFSLREAPEPVVVDLHNQPAPNLLRTYPLQMEMPTAIGFNRRLAEGGSDAPSLRLVDCSPAPPKPAWTARLARFKAATKLALCWKPHFWQRKRRVLNRLEGLT
jgi:hypothetical protein